MKKLLILLVFIGIFVGTATGVHQLLQMVSTPKGQIAKQANSKQANAEQTNEKQPVYITKEGTPLGNIQAAIQDVTPVEYNKEGRYQVFVNEQLLAAFDTYDEAFELGQTYQNVIIKDRNTTAYLWDNYKPFVVYTDLEHFEEFDTYQDAMTYGKQVPEAFLYYRKDRQLLWTNTMVLPESYQISNVPLIAQLPELPRGCEVTSLAMLLNYKNIDVDKHTLAEEIIKDTTPMEMKDGMLYYGNPNHGFVGDLYSLKNPGLGVYHHPIYELLAQYFPTSSLDITGVDFENIMYFISNNIPVWVILNNTYDVLPESAFETWQTAEGPIQITYKEHAVLITGYDADHIYFNDPLNQKKSAPRGAFENAWRQMGSQAITLTN